MKIASTTSHMIYSNDFQLITGTDIYYSSTSQQLGYSNYFIHVPLFLYLIILVPFTFIIGRLIIEFIIRMRK